MPVELEGRRFLIKRVVGQPIHEAFFGNSGKPSLYIAHAELDYEHDAEDAIEEEETLELLRGINTALASIDIHLQNTVALLMEIRDSGTRNRDRYKG